MLSFLAKDLSTGNGLCFGLASVPRPASATDWSLTLDLGGIAQLGDAPPALCAAGSKAAMCYFKDNGATKDLYYFTLIDASGSFDAPPHYVDGFPASNGACALTLREGRPLITIDNGGLRHYQAAIAEPQSWQHWSVIQANPLYTSFYNLDTLCSGTWIYSTGASGLPSDSVVFNLSNTPAPSGPLDFWEYGLAPDSGASPFPVLAMAGGIPCVAATDLLGEALHFYLAASPADSSAGVWQAHPLASGLGQIRDPSLAMLEGRPAVCAGTAPLNFYWTGGQWPDAAEDWRAQQIHPDIVASGSALVVVDGLPIVAFSTFTQNGSNISLAVAREL
jgi:hypothetical protein